MKVSLINVVLFFFPCISAFAGDVEWKGKTNPARSAVPIRVAVYNRTPSMPPNTGLIGTRSKSTVQPITAARQEEGVPEPDDMDHLDSPSHEIETNYRKPSVPIRSLNQNRLYDEPVQHPSITERTTPIRMVSATKKTDDAGVVKPADRSAAPKIRSSVFLDSSLGQRSVF